MSEISNQLTIKDFEKVHDKNYLRDKKVCPLCLGHQIIDTDRSNAFGLGLNAPPETKNPFSYSKQHALFINFRIGKDCQTRETLKQLFERLL